MALTSTPMVTGCSDSPAAAPPALSWNPSRHLRRQNPLEIDLNNPNPSGPPSAVPPSDRQNLLLRRPEPRWELRSRSANPKKPSPPSDAKPDAPPSNPPPKGPTSGGERKRGTKKNKKREPASEFRLLLTKEEVEADFLALTGAKPPRRPIIKRPRVVQNHLDSLYPGSTFPKTLAPDRY